jgi:nicotinamide riboside transporter PnuC|tara:strand:- start:651 stop:905 length:255 start_codon:yes stop_codon:yes gene_type:complete
MIDNWEEAWREYLGRIIEKLGWVSMFLIVLGYYFNANQNSFCWVIWLIGNILMGTYCCHKKTYPPAVLSFLIAGMNIYGYFSWL